MTVGGGKVSPEPLSHGLAQAPKVRHALPQLRYLTLEFHNFATDDRNLAISPRTV